MSHLFIIFYFILVLINTAVTFYLIYLFVDRYLKTRINVIFLLIITAILTIITTGIILQIFLSNSSSLIDFHFRQDNNTRTLLFLLGVIASGNFLFFLDYFAEEKIPFIHVSSYSVLATSYTIYAIVDLYDEEITSLFFSYLSYVPYLTFIFITIIGNSILLHVKKNSVSYEQEWEITNFQIALFFFFIIPPIIIVIGDIFIEFSVVLSLFFTYNLIVASILVGNLFLIKIFSSSKLPLLQFYIPYRILVLSKLDQVVFAKEMFDTSSQFVTSLFSGGFSAVSSIMDELLDVGNATRLEFDRGSIMSRRRDTFNTLLIVQKQTKFLSRSLSLFAELFDEEFGERCQEHPSTYIDDKKADQIVEQAFGL